MRSRTIVNRVRRQLGRQSEQDARSTQLENMIHEARSSAPKGDRTSQIALLWDRFGKVMKNLNRREKTFFRINGLHP